MSKITEAIKNKENIRTESLIIQNYHEIGIPVTEMYLNGRFFAVDNDGYISIRLTSPWVDAAAHLNQFLAAVAPQYRIEGLLLMKGDKGIAHLSTEWVILPF